jgi:hypothetical protein
MGNSKNSNQKPKKDREVEVLYQKLGGKWFAFSLIDDEVFFGKVEGEKSASEDSFEGEAEADFLASPSTHKKMPDLDQ